MTSQPDAPTVSFPLWSDDPSPDDLLAFNALAQTLVDPLLDARLDPVALGLSGPWGSGKSTVLGLIDEQLKELSADDAKVLVVPTQPWRYDPTLGAKETLIGEVLGVLQAEVKANAGDRKEALDLVKRLARRVDWAKALKVAAKAGVAMQIPSIDDLVDLVKPKDAEEGPAGERGLDAFRDEFAQLMGSEELKHVKAVVVLVDDLDRCLPRTVVESLEAMRLFLSVPRMSFVIAADEDRVADALREEFPPHEAPVDGDDVEEPAKLYLHKIVQTTLPIPVLSRFDTQVYVFLLQVQATRVDDLARLTAICDQLRTTGGSLDDLEVSDADAFAEEIQFAARLTPLLYEKLRGNPRRIKRFLNDLYIRRTVAQRRGIELDVAVIAKLMVLEVLFPDAFARILEWLSKGELRSRMAELESAAGRPESVVVAASVEADDADDEDEAKPNKTTTKKTTAPKPTEPASESFPEALLRWAKLPPALKDLDLAPYLYLAASFKAQPMLDHGLPERLKDLAVNMLSSSRRERTAVSDADLAALPSGDVEELANYFGRLVRDQPSQQKFGVSALLRLARQSPTGPGFAAKALAMIPVGDVAFGTPILFTGSDPAEVLEVLTSWRERSTDTRVKTAVDEALKVAK